MDVTTTEPQVEAQTIQDQPATDQSSIPDNTNQVKAEPDQSAPVDDGWGAANDAFKESGPLEDLNGPVIDYEEVVEAQPGSEDSQLEVKPEDSQTQETQTDQEVADPTKLNLKFDINENENLKTVIPHKYRPLIQQEVDSFKNEASKQFDEGVKGYRESNSALANAFVDVINSDNPVETLLGYAKEAVPAYNLPQEIITKLEAKVPKQVQPGQADQTSNTGAGQGQVDWNAVNTRAKDEIGKIRQKYDSELVQTTDPTRFMQLMDARSSEIDSIKDAVRQAQIKTMFMGYHQKLVKPHNDQLAKIQEGAKTVEANAAIESQRNGWRNADTEMSNNFKDDWPKYRKQVNELLKTSYRGSTDQANSSGQGHYELVKDLYYKVSRKDHLEAAARPNRGMGGIRTTNKHIQIQKPGGSDWYKNDDIKNSVWSDVISD